jgi:hypothetical protein
VLEVELARCKPRRSTRDNEVSTETLESTHTKKPVSAVQAVGTVSGDNGMWAAILELDTLELVG